MGTVWFAVAVARRHRVEAHHLSRLPPGDPGARRPDGALPLSAGSSPTDRRSTPVPDSQVCRSDHLRRERRLLLSLGTHLSWRVQVTDNRRFRTDDDARRDPIHTSGGMAEPAAAAGPSARRRRHGFHRHVRGALLARAGYPAGLRRGAGGAAGGARVGGDPAAAGAARGVARPPAPARGRVRQLPQAGGPGAGRAERPGPGGAGHPAARRAGRHGPSERRGRRARLAGVAARGRRRWWTGSSGRSWRRRASSGSTRWASRSIPACTRRCPSCRRHGPSWTTR